MARRIVVTGAGGQLGTELVRVLTALGDHVVALHHDDFDITHAPDLDRLAGGRPDVVVNSAAWTDVDGCARDPERAMLINGLAPGRLAAAAERIGALVVHVSTNEVFAGDRDAPYSESDVPQPINPYGVSKLAGEQAVARAASRHLLIRTAWIYGGPASFPVKIRVAAQRAGTEDRLLRIVADEHGNPTPAGPLAERIAQAVELILRDGGPSVIHLAGEPPASRYEWATRILGPATPIEPITQKEYPRLSQPPRRAVLSTRLAARLGLSPIRWQDHPG